MKLCFLTLAFVLLAPGAYSATYDTTPQDFAYCSNIRGYGSEAEFGQPTSVFLDERSASLYITDTKAGVVDVFTLQGVPVTQYSDGLKAPFGVALDVKGSIYVSEDEAGPLKVINSKGEVTKLEIPSDDPKVTPKLGRITLDKDDNLYIVDRATNRILVLDKDRKLIVRIGAKGNKRGQFRALQDVTVDHQGRIYALDSTGVVPVQVFDKKGKYLYRLTAFQGDGDQDISAASGLFIDRNDQVWVVDRGQHALKVFDRAGTFLRRFGTYGTGDGSLFYPIDAKTDNVGRIYVLEAGALRLQTFSLTRPFESFTPPNT